MPHPDEMYHKMESLSMVERKEFEELKHYHSEYQRRQREKNVFYGYCIVAAVAAAIVFGMLKFETIWSN